ncbi:DNA-dependent RNA polymerase, putative [Angomonas deanei]|uniref:DNA-directed RNA polymerase n=1 Tax=Angomonas deanei TaxID=59799 RepID=A0A7G2CLS7_9TRYP|nr:DNA-dependent RNA polymerase, putative [Angomonas deanei]
MTALEMNKRGLSMMAVHDSYWTYACDLPQLSAVLREQFVHLYTHYDPLWQLKHQWEEMYFRGFTATWVDAAGPTAAGDARP